MTKELSSLESLRNEFLRPCLGGDQDARILCFCRYAWAILSGARRKGVVEKNGGWLEKADFMGGGKNRAKPRWIF